VARHDHPGHEAAEDHRDADFLGHERGHQHAGEYRRKPAARNAPLLVVGRRDAGQQRPRHQRHHQAERHGQRHRDQHGAGRARHRNRRRERDQEPRRNVVDGGAGQRERTHGPFEHAPLHQDAGQHGEGGDRHRDAHEEGEGDELLVGPDERVDRDRHGHAEHHRERHARVRDRGRLTDPPPELAHVNLQPDQEHVEDQPQVGGDPERRKDVRREEQRLQVCRYGPQDGRAERDAGHDLAHHPRLSELDRDGSEQARDEDDHRHGDEEAGDHQSEGLPLLGRCELLARGRQARARGYYRLAVCVCGAGRLCLVEGQELEVVEVAVDGLRL
jgi:hypothetical protein